VKTVVFHITTKHECNDDSDDGNESAEEGRSKRRNELIDTDVTNYITIYTQNSAPVTYACIAYKKRTPTYLLASRTLKLVT